VLLKGKTKREGLKERQIPELLKRIDSKTQKEATKRYK
jgi:hypothetical protein